MSDLVDEISLRRRCPYCLVRAGDWCQTKTGNVSTYLHAGRSADVRQAYAHGWWEGQIDAFRYSRDYPEAFAASVARWGDRL